MSSPLESLKKNRKTPLNGAEKLNRAPYKKVYNVADILHEKMQNNNNADKDRLQSKSREHTSQAPTDMELLSSMAGHLAQTEQQLRYTTKELIDKDKKIRILEDKVQLLEKARGYSSDTVKDLEMKCKYLQEQVHDMEEFLADYGMIWVGPDDPLPSDDMVEEGNVLDKRNDIDSPGIWEPGSSLAFPSTSFEMDFNLVVKNIGELNMLSGSSTIVSPTKGGATLKNRDLVPLTLYANGILMFSGPFRPYSDETTQCCMQDIMDGYFPSELQTRYPDGVPFKVIDKREVVYKDRRTELLFPGSGQPLHDNNINQSPNNDQTNKIYSINELKDNQEYKMPVEKFLKNLPPSVIKNGKIIDVRSGVAETLKGSSPTDLEENKVTVIETPVIKEIKSRAEIGSGRPLSAHQVTTLRIKSEKGDQPNVKGSELPNGERNLLTFRALALHHPILNIFIINARNTYILKMRFTDTIGDVRQYINQIRPELDDNYSIKTSFPNNVHEDVGMTLREAKLTPNATLHILLRK